VTSPDGTPHPTGLTAAEVADRVAAGQVNTIPEPPTRTVPAIIRANTLTPINLIIGILAALVLIAGSPKDALFAGVIVANSGIGIVQEIRAKRVLDRLRVVTAPHVTVRRDGTSIPITVDQLVLDDLVELRAGTQLVADGDVVHADELEIDESLLTGESDPVVRHPGDRVLSGSAVVAGTGLVRVTAVGAENYAARLAEEARRFTLVDSALRQDIDRIVSRVGLAIIPVGLLLASSQFLRTEEGWREAVISTVAGLVGMVPEGLVLLTSVAFAVGVVRLAARRCLVQELPAIEVLARVDVLCADKTGTITTGALSLVEAVELAPGARRALAAMVADDPDPNATSRAIAAGIGHHHDDTDTEADRAWAVTARTPFSSARRTSSVTFVGHGTWTLGAPAAVIPPDHPATGQVHALMASGRRVLGLADDTGPTAIIVLDDEVRPDAPATLGWFASEGVDLRVISGDDPTTVAAVARRAGLDTAPDAVIDASTMPAAEDASTDPGFADTVRRGRVFGRVDPHRKRAMVDALKADGHTVAMTGDGVNDVLALKNADCGIAMASGSDATRSVAQLVLLDSDFSALPAVVAEGRRVINNIERVASLFLAKTTYSLLLSVLVGIAGTTYPLRPIHLTLLSWCTIGIPAFFLALEPDTERVRPGFLTRVLTRAVPAGIVIAGAVLAVSAVVPRITEATNGEVRTAAVTTAGAIALIHLTLVARPLDRRRLALIVVMTGLFVLAFAVPAGRDLFDVPLPPATAWIAVAVAIGLARPVISVVTGAATRIGDQ
jgi:cation-transporting ATPase E